MLGGLLSDRFLGQAKPVPDADHSKQHDYLESIESWADWGGLARPAKHTQLPGTHSHPPPWLLTLTLLEPDSLAPLPR